MYIVVFLFKNNIILIIKNSNLFYNAFIFLYNNYTKKYNITLFVIKSSDFIK